MRCFAHYSRVDHTVAWAQLLTTRICITPSEAYYYLHAPQISGLHFEVPGTSEFNPRVNSGFRKRVAIYLRVAPLWTKSYAVANTQFASEWGHIHHFWLSMAVFERVMAV